MLVAPRIVNDVSYVTRIKDEILFTWQAQCGDVGAPRLANEYFVVQEVVPE